MGKTNKQHLKHLQKQHYEQYMAQLNDTNDDTPVPVPVTPGLSNKEIRIEQPSMWTRPQIKELKDQLRKDSESVLTVGRGEVVTVRYYLKCYMKRRIRINLVLSGYQLTKKVRIYSGNSHRILMIWDSEFILSGAR